jgi:hypothetical protein
MTTTTTELDRVLARLRHEITSLEADRVGAAKSVANPEHSYAFGYGWLDAAIQRAINVLTSAVTELSPPPPIGAYVRVVWPDGITATDWVTDHGVDGTGFLLESAGYVSLDEVHRVTILD